MKWSDAKFSEMSFERARCAQRSMQAVSTEEEVPKIEPGVRGVDAGHDWDDHFATSSCASALAFAEETVCAKVDDVGCVAIRGCTAGCNPGCASFSDDECDSCGDRGLVCSDARPEYSHEKPALKHDKC